MVDGGVLQTPLLWTAEEEFRHKQLVLNHHVCLGERVKPFAAGLFAEWLEEGLFIF